MEQDADKTHDPTPHRRQQAREQGQVARSQDLGSAALLAGGLLVLVGLGRPLVDFLGGYTAEMLGGRAWLAADADFLAGQSWALLGALAGVLLPVLGALALVAAGTSLAQVGLVFLPEKLVPDLRRIDPVQGFRRIFSLAGCMRLLLGFFKLGVVSAVAYASVVQQRDTILGLAELAPPQVAVALLEMLFWTTMKIALALLLLALLDYGFQWWKQEQDLRMTTQELREEMKNLQGDPQIIARRKAVQRQLVINRLKSAVPRADVVVTNPTELAVAIQYQPETMHAPIVVAKGAGVLAQQIRRLALEHGIPIVEKKPLAQALYKEVDVNRPIPSQLYAAVAEVLAYVYQLQGKTMPGQRGAA